MKGIGAIQLSLGFLHVGLASLSSDPKHVAKVYQEWLSAHAHAHAHVPGGKSIPSPFPETPPASFVDNLRFLENWDQEEKASSTYRLGLNRFSYLSEEEKQALLTGYIPPGNSSFIFVEKDVGHTPDGLQEEETVSSVSHSHSVDPSIYNQHRITQQQQQQSSVDWEILGGVTNVKDQGYCLASWSFVATGALEGAYFAKYGTLPGDMSCNGYQGLSEQHFISCDSRNGGCGGGNQEITFIGLRDDMGYIGIKSERESPFVSYFFNSADVFPPSPPSSCLTFTSNAMWSSRLRTDPQTPLTRIYPTVPTIQGLRVTGLAKEADLIAALRNQPVAVAVKANSYLFAYTGGILDGNYIPDYTLCKQVNLAVLLVGYGTSADGIPYWRLRNQWGTSWGDNGYFYVKRDEGKNPLGLLCYPTVPNLVSAPPLISPYPTSEPTSSPAVPCTQEISNMGYLPAYPSYPALLSIGVTGDSRTVTFTSINLLGSNISSTATPLPASVFLVSQTNMLSVLSNHLNLSSSNLSSVMINPTPQVSYYYSVAKQNDLLKAVTFRVYVEKEDVLADAVGAWIATIPNSPPPGWTPTPPTNDTILSAGFRFTSPNTAIAACNQVKPLAPSSKVSINNNVVSFSQVPPSQQGVLINALRSQGGIMLYTPPPWGTLDTAFVNLLFSLDGRQDVPISSNRQSNGIGITSLAFQETSNMSPTPSPSVNQPPFTLTTAMPTPSLINYPPTRRPTTRPTIESSSSLSSTSPPPKLDIGVNMNVKNFNVAIMKNNLATPIKRVQCILSFKEAVAYTLNLDPSLSEISSMTLSINNAVISPSDVSTFERSLSSESSHHTALGSSVPSSTTRRLQQFPSPSSSPTLVVNYVLSVQRPGVTLNSLTSTLDVAIQQGMLSSALSYFSITNGITGLNGTSIDLPTYTNVNSESSSNSTSNDSNSTSMSQPQIIGIVSVTVSFFLTCMYLVGKRRGWLHGQDICGGDGDGNPRSTIPQSTAAIRVDGFEDAPVATAEYAHTRTSNHNNNNNNNNNNASSSRMSLRRISPFANRSALSTNDHDADHDHYDYDNDDGETYVITKATYAQPPRGKDGNSLHDWEEGGELEDEDSLGGVCSISMVNLPTARQL